MRVAVVHPYPVNAAAVGGTTRVLEFVRFLAPRHDVTVFTHAAADDDAVAQAPSPGTSVSYPRPRLSMSRRLTWLAGNTPYAVRYNWNRGLFDTARAADRECPFDVVHMELGYMAPFARAFGPSAVRVLAEQECQALAIARLRSVPWRRLSWFERSQRWSATRVQAYDRTMLRTFDLIYGITEHEARYLAGASGHPVAVLPHVVRASRFAAEPQVTDSRVLFVGNFAHRPNVEAIEWFAEAVWPRVRARVPAAVCDVVGKSLPDALAERLKACALKPVGFVPALEEVYRRAAVVVNPVRLGAGMRGKVLEAFAAGAAVVSTAVGLEGIDAVSGEHCEVANDAKAFADAVGKYLRQDDVRLEHGSNARALVRARYDADGVFTRLEAEVTAAVAARRAEARRS